MLKYGVSSIYELLKAELASVFFHLFFVGKYRKIARFFNQIVTLS